MRRAAIGLFLRLLIATAISLIVGWLFITPFDRLPFSRSAVTAIVTVLNFPVALAGEVFYPIRGAQLLFDDGATWCDFCSAGEVLRRQTRLAIPVYLFVLYVPTPIRWTAHRHPRLLRRALIGLGIYAAVTAAFFLAIDGRAGRADVWTALMWLAILAAAAAFAWSNLAPRWKAGAVIAVLLAGAWALPFAMTFVIPKMDAVQPYFISYLVLLTFGVTGMLWLTWMIESLAGRWRRGGRAESIRETRG